MAQEEDRLGNNFLRRVELGDDPIDAANTTRHLRLSIYLPLIGLALAVLAILAMAFGWV